MLRDRILKYIEEYQDILNNKQEYLEAIRNTIYYEDEGLYLEGEIRQLKQILQTLTFLSTYGMRKLEDGCGKYQTKV